MRCGLSSVVPLQLLSLLTPQDLKLRVCGLSEINLNYLRVNTTLIFVLNQSPPPVTHNLSCWTHGHRPAHSVLLDCTREFHTGVYTHTTPTNTSYCKWLLQEELTKFIKFACNQERIPFGFSCRQDHETHPHVPPYPMKIAPPDGAGEVLHSLFPFSTFLLLR